MAPNTKYHIFSQKVATKWRQISHFWTNQLHNRALRRCAGSEAAHQQRHCRDTQMWRIRQSRCHSPCGPKSSETIKCPPTPCSLISSCLLDDMGPRMVLFPFCFLNLLSCPFPLLFAAFWRWKLPFPQRFATFWSNLSFSVAFATFWCSNCSCRMVFCDQDSFRVGLGLVHLGLA